MEEFAELAAQMPPILERFNSLSEEHGVNQELQERVRHNIIDTICTLSEVSGIDLIGRFYPEFIR